MAALVQHTPFTCAHCNGPFEPQPSMRAPVTASPCGHMFCKTCLATLRGGAHAACSLCSQEITGEVSNIGVGFVSEAKRGGDADAGAKWKDESHSEKPQALDATASRGAAKKRKVTLPVIPPHVKALDRFCCACTAESMQTVATHACGQCAGGLDFCEVHSRAHQSLRGHPMKLCAYAVVGTPSASLLLHAACPDHPGQVCQRFCVDHNKLLCPECCVFEHPTTSHSVQSLDALIGHFKERINGMVPLLAAQSSAAMGSSGNVACLIPSLEACAKNVLDSIDTAGMQLQAAMATAVSTARAHTEQLFESRKALLALKSRELAITSHQLSAVHEVCGRALAQGTSTPLAAALQDAESQCVLLQPLCEFVTPVAFGVIVNSLAVEHAIRSAFEFVEDPIDLTACNLIAAGMSHGDDIIAEPCCIRFSPIGAAGNLVHLSVGDVRLAITNTVGESVGTSTVTVSGDGSGVVIHFDVPNTSVKHATATLRVHKQVLHEWRMPLVSVMDLLAHLGLLDDCANFVCAIRQKHTRPELH